MEHYREGQYDDDLTVGMDEYDDDIDAGAVDLFDYVGEDDSPLARLKSIILSIDWEITDDILRQFNEELIDLKDIWAGNKINLIYVQALQKLSRYIYKEKADAHPNTIKLLLTFYANLEKIVSSTSISDEEKKSLLMEDVQRFEKLKKQIGRLPESTPVQSEAQPATEKGEDETVEPSLPGVAIESDVSETSIAPPAFPASPDIESKIIDESTPLLNLKAIVYGIDWEITERDLANLSKEVNLLEKRYQSNKAKLIFLQGIGSLGAYINLKRSDAHPEAFKLLHSFFLGLEKVVEEDLSGVQEKNILMPEVQKFNAFKAAIADTISSDAMAKEAERIKKAELVDEQHEEDIQPAFSDMPEDVHGFREDEELAAIKDMDGDSLAVVSAFELDEDEFVEQPEKSESALASEMESRLSGMFDEPGKEAMDKLDADVALQGVDVESDADDESEEEPLPEEGGELAPALASEQDAMPTGDSPAVFTDQLDDFFDESETVDTAMVGTALPGVDVESDADDDSDEEPLPFEGGEFAPALSSEDDEDFRAAGEEEDFAPAEVEQNLDNFFGDSTETADVTPSTQGEGDESAIREEQSTSEIEDRFDDFFGTDDVAPSFEHADAPLDGVNVESEADEDFEEEPLPSVDGELIPALNVGDEGFADIKEEHAEDTADVEDRFDDLFGEEEAVAEPSEAQDIDLEFEADDGAEEDAQIVEEDSGAVLTEGVSVEEEETTVSQTAFTSVDTEAALLGVDVETDDDDESDEEPLLYENDELAPALSVEDEGLSDTDETAFESEDESESIVADQFDAFFSTDEEEIVKDDIEAATTVEPEQPVDEDQASDADSIDITPFDEAGFEEILDDDIAMIAIESEEHVDEEAALQPETTAHDEPIEDRLADLFPLDDEEEEAFSAPDTDSAILDYSEEQLLEAVAEMDEIEEIPAENVVALFDEDKAIDTDEYSASSALLDEFDKIAGEDEDYISATDERESAVEQEEEVVFEPVVEDEIDLFLSEGDVADSTQVQSAQLSDYDDLDTFGTQLLSEETIKKDEHRHVVTDKVEIESVFGDLDEVESLTAIDEQDKYDDSAYVDSEMVPTQDSLNALRDCIISLGLEINDVILGSLTVEIEKLRHSWMDKPLEKTYLQLLSAITLHIERFRYEADPDANKLLLSIFDKLEITCLKEQDAAQLQEILLAETSKVLQWQQKLIDRKPSARGIEQERLDEKSEVHFQEKLESEHVPEALFGEIGDDKVFSSELGDIAEQIQAGADKDELINKVSLMMKSELDLLKDTFRQEIQELKNELKQEK